MSCWSLFYEFVHCLIGTCKDVLQNIGFPLVTRNKALRACRRLARALQRALKRPNSLLPNVTHDEGHYPQCNRYCDDVNGRGAEGVSPVNGRAFEVERDLPVRVGNVEEAGGLVEGARGIGIAVGYKEEGPALRGRKLRLDVELPYPDCYPELIDPVKEGSIPESLVDSAVERVLRLKFLMGLFNDRLKPLDTPGTLESNDHREVALNAARESIVLLKNNGLLPLKKNRRIALIGPNAASDAALLGDYHYMARIGLGAVATPVVSILEGLKRISGIEVKYAKGCDINSKSREGFADAIATWYPGEEGGTAIAEIIFGNANPSGRLPVSFPKSVGQVPVYYYLRRSWHSRSGERPYAGSRFEPLFPFGFGLSYSTLRYESLVTPDILGPNENAQISFTIKNEGPYDGVEVPQLYISKESASVARPIKELKGFSRVSLKVGETKRIQFTLPSEALAYYDRDGKLAVEAGNYSVIIGRSSSDVELKGQFKIASKKIINDRRYYLSTAEVLRIN